MLELSPFIFISQNIIIIKFITPIFDDNDRSLFRDIVATFFLFFYFSFNFFFFTDPFFFILGATIDCLKRADWTPLMLACTKIGSEACKCIRILLEAKADPLRRNKDGWVPAFIICRSGDVNALRLFLDFAPESIDLRSNNGRSSLHIAGDYTRIFFFFTI